MPCFQSHPKNNRHLTLNGYVPKKVPKKEKKVGNCQGCCYFRPPNFCGLNDNFSVSALMEACDSAIPIEEAKRKRRRWFW